MITGASSGIGRAAAMKIAAAGGIPLLVARTMDKLEEAKAEIEAARRHRVRLLVPTSPTSTPIDELVEQMLADHAASTCSSTTPGRSIRRSIALSYDRFHDFERTMQLNYFGAIR